MAHVHDDQLYSIFHRLVRHERGGEPIEGLEIDEDLKKVLKRVPRDGFKEPPAAEHAVSEDAVRKAVAHSQKCPKCQILVYEAGPHATRLRSKEEKAQDAMREAEESQRLTWRFYWVTVVGIAAFVGAHYSMVKYRTLDDTHRAVGENVLRGVETGIQFHPLLLLFGLLIIVAAFALAESWRIANELWLDWTRAKEAVPFVGKRWAERGRRKKSQKRATG